MGAPTRALLYTQATLVLAALAIAPTPVQSQEPARGRAIVKCVIAGETVYTDLSCSEAARIARELSPGDSAADSAPDPSEPAPASPSAEAPTYYAVVLDLPNTPAYGRNPECPHLEQRMALVEAEGKATAGSEALSRIEERLAVQRSWHRQLGC